MLAPTLALLLFPHPQATEPAVDSIGVVVDAACLWLAGHQAEDGHWSSGTFAQNGPANPVAPESDDAFWDRVLDGDAPSEAAAPAGPTPRAGGPSHDVGVTGLALLALLEDGNTATSGPHASAVARGLAWLAGQQDGESGRLGTPSGPAHHYDHAVATLALARGALGDPNGALDDTLRKAVDYILLARNPYGAWRYESPPNGDNDTSVTTWMVLALKAAEEAGVSFDTAAYAGARHWFESVTDETTGRAGYTERGSTSARVPGMNDHLPAAAFETLTAGALLAELRMGLDARSHERMIRRVKLILEHPPKSPHEPGLDLIGIHWATGALAAVGSRPWRAWRAAAAPALLASRQLSDDGSTWWPADNVWGDSMGSVGATALASMTLSVVERSGPVPAPPPARGLSAEDSAKAVNAGLEWLKNHQDEDGKWDCNEFHKHDPLGQKTDGAGDPSHDIGCTGLALLAFLGDGNTMVRGPYKDVVKKGIKWLISEQDRETGLFGEEIGHAFLYDHAIATLAICETYYIDKSVLVKAKAQKAIHYIGRARNPYGVWRYDVPPNGDNDTSISAWMVFAIQSAEEAGLAVDKEAYTAALQWFDEMTDPGTGRVGYTEVGSASSRVPGMNDQYPTDKGEALTAVTLLSRFFMGQDPDDNATNMQAHAELLLKTLPKWDPEGFGCDMYYWYYGSYAMFQMGGKYWKEWNKAMKPAVVESQRKDGTSKGSWDPVGPWGYAGGRVYSTATMVLCLEVYFRYAKVLGAR